MNRPALVLEPPPSVAACSQCQRAYAEAKKVMEDAGGIAKWMEVVTT
jgi:hypothetical protein